jgi:hypothetical protein
VGGREVIVCLTEQYGTDLREDETLRELKEDGRTDREIRWLFIEYEKETTEERAL